MQLKTNFNRDRCKMELQSVKKTKPKGKLLNEKKYTKNKANTNEMVSTVQNTFVRALVQWPSFGGEKKKQ